jgi:hypothetical protein
MQNSTSSVKATNTNAADLFLSMKPDSPIDELSVLMRYPLLRFFIHYFFNAGAEILEHDGRAISTWAAGH